MIVRLRVVECYVGDVARSIALSLIDGIDKALIRRKVELLITCQNLFVQYGVNLHAIRLNQLTSAFVVTRTLNALNLGQQFAKQVAKSCIVVYLHIGLAMLLYQFYHLSSLAMFVSPTGNEGTIAHVSLFNIVTRLDTYQLRHKAIHHIRVILTLISLQVGRKS